MCLYCFLMAAFKLRQPWFLNKIKIRKPHLFRTCCTGRYPSTNQEAQIESSTSGTMKIESSFNLVDAHPPYLPAPTAVKEESASLKCGGHGGPPPDEPRTTARDGQRRTHKTTKHQTRNTQVGYDGFASVRTFFSERVRSKWHNIIGRDHSNR